MSIPLLLDCTFRDGGYQNNWDFDDSLVSESCLRLDECGVDYIEIGYKNIKELYNNKICGKWRYSSEEDINSVISETRNYKIAVLTDFASSDINLFLPKENSIIDLVRVAFHKSDMNDAILFCDQLKKLGYEVSANAMVTMNYTNEELIELSNLCVQYNLDYLYVADSYGCINFDEIDNIVTTIKTITDRTSVKLGFHSHNNLQNAYGNLAYSVKNNYFDIYDGSLSGMGRGSGNLCTELLLTHFNKPILPILIVINNYFLKDNQIYSVNWGYSIYYVICAYFKAHPNYIIKLTEDYKITNLTDIWNIFTQIVGDNEHKLFNLTYLNSIVVNYLI